MRGHQDLFNPRNHELFIQKLMPLPFLLHFIFDISVIYSSCLTFSANTLAACEASDSPDQIYRLGQTEKHTGKMQTKAKSAVCQLTVQAYL